eukprot:Hpha_TRINITY_DN27767_c0_g1::TRINITY_DN27767_c0_g1_i1::g.157062::m.157062
MGEPAEDARNTDTEWELTLERFPPMPIRNRKEMNSESVGGIIVVLGIIGAILAMSHFLLADKLDTGPKIALFVLVYGESCVAIICLCYLLLGDAGEVVRTKDTCFPIPAPVEEHLREGRHPADAGMRNIMEGGKSYCVRCLLWRNDLEHPHHCSTCQRCVQGFDHHCGVFGRCIAKGNMTYFKLIIAMGVFGILTFIIFLIVTSIA